MEGQGIELVLTHAKMCVCVSVCPLTPQLLLPLHLAVQEGGLIKEVRDLGALLVLLSGVEHSEL